MSNENADLEAPLNPSTQDSELKWAFVRKVYLIVTVQFVVTFAVAAAVAFVQPLFNFFSDRLAAGVFYLLAMIVLIFVILALLDFNDKYPYNFILLGIGTLCIGLALGLETKFISGVVIVEAGITIIAVVLSFLAYTFLASWRGQNFGFIVPSLLSVTVTIGLYIIYQIYFPMGSIAYVICSGLVVLMLSAPFILFTNLFEGGDQYILASIALYFCLGVICILPRLVRAFIAKMFEFFHS